jgi:aryl-alcohol dehydrogenase-like predicted oxidoreductase
VLDALERLVADGLVRAYGWSTDDPAAARLLTGRPHAAAVQHERNVLQDAGAMLEVCERLGLASVNRSPLGMGLLSGKFRAGSRLSGDDVRGDEPAWMKYFRDGRPSPEWLARLDAVREVLTAGGRTLVQGALAWIWHAAAAPCRSRGPGRCGRSRRTPPPCRPARWSPGSSPRSTCCSTAPRP